MVQVIQRNRTPGEIAAESLGQGIAGGLSGAIEGFQKHQQQTVTAQALGSFAGFDENKIKLLGALPVELQQHIVENYSKRQKERGSLSKMLSSELKNYKDEDFSGEDYNDIRTKARELFDQGYDPQEAIEQATQAHLSRPSSKQGVSKTMRNLEENTGISPQGFSQGIKDVGVGALKGIRPFIEHLSGGSPMTNPSALANLLTQTPNTDLQKFDVITQGKGRPENATERVVSGYPLGAPGIVGEYAREAARAGGASERVQDVASFIGAVMGGKLRLPEPKMKAVRRVVENASKVSEKTGQPAEQVLSEAQQRSGADLAKAAEGNAEEINKLNRAITKEVPEVGKKVEAAPKEFAQPKTEIAAREKTVERLKERPLEEYYKPEKEVKHKPETVVKQQEVRQRVEPLLNAKNKELSQAQSDLSKLKESRKSIPEESKGRIEAGIKHAEDVQIPRLHQQIEELKYELREFKKQPSLEEIQDSVTKSGKTFIEEAKNPTPEGQKKIEAQIEKDKQYIERAAKLAEKGKLEGEIKPDTFIKMKQAYLDGYNGLIHELRDELRSLKGARDQEGLKAIADRRQAVRHLEQRTARLKADIQNQTDKLKVRGHLEKPSGAFYKQQLKTARSDVEAFQKDFIKEHKHRIEPGERKADLVARKELAKTIQQAQQKPTLENINKVAHEAGVPKEQIKKLEENIKKDVKEGHSHEEIMKEHAKKTEEIAQKTSQGVKNKTGSSVLGNKSKRFILDKLGQAIFIAATGGSGASVYTIYKNYQKNSEIDAYLKALESGDREDIRKMRREMVAKGYSAAKINNISKAAKARQRSKE